MRASAYNYPLHLPSGEIAVYNVLNDSFVEMSKAEYDALSKEAFEEFNTKATNILLENGLVVEDSFAEKEFLRYQFEKTRYLKDTLVITLAPTLNCNFKCPYCYESPRTGLMTDDGFRSVLGFIEESCRSNHFKVLQVNWYGGEPMLAIENIAKWSQRLIDFCEIQGISYKSHMISNGSLINESNLGLITKSRISNLQITLDGWGETHDQRRPARDGRPRFGAILKAIEMLAAAGIDVSCRMNVDKNNIDEYDKLAKHFSGNERINVHVGHLRDYEPLPTPPFSCFTCEEFSKAELEAFKKSSYSISDLKSIFSRRQVFCGACIDNSYVIDERCNVYKCWNSIGDESQVVFNLTEPQDNRPINYTTLCQYMNCNPLNDPECSQCIWLPICGGGCIYETNSLNSKFCYPPIHVIKSYLFLYYEEVNKDESCQKS